MTLDITGYDPTSLGTCQQVLPFCDAALSLLSALGVFALVLLAVAFVVQLARWAFGVHSGHIGAAGGGLHALVVIFLAIIGIAAAAAIVNHFLHWGLAAVH